MKKLNTSNIFIYTGLFLLTLYICFTSCLNPIGVSNIDHDTSVFLTITQGITRGQVPFRDFYDNKGPLLYILSAPGYALGKFTGVWFTELLLMCISIFFAYKTALFFGSRKFAFIGTVLGFIVFQSFFYEVAGTEEYSLPFMMISIYIFTKFYFNRENVSPLEIIILGFCFGSSVLIRINLFSLWFGFCFIISIQLIIKREFINLIKYMTLFCTGFLIIIIPILFYLISSNALTDYINQNFIAGGSRGLSGFNILHFIKSFFIFIDRNFSFAPLLAGFLWIIRDLGNKKEYYIGYLLGFIITVIFHAIIRTNYTHYNMTITPFLVPAFTFLSMSIYEYFKDLKYCNTYFIIFICILFSTTWFEGIDRMNHIYRSHSRQERKNLILSGRIIDENTNKGDKIISLGFPCRIYLFTQRDSASRYIYQTSGVNYDKNAQNEFLNDILINKPAIIVIEEKNGGYNHLPEWYIPIYDLIEKEYKLITDKHGYFIFKLIHELQNNDHESLL